MSIKVMSWVWENGPDDPVERLVLLALADFADDHGCCYPSMIGIGEKACITERGARGVVRRLESTGWVETSIGGGRGGKSRYHIIMAINPERETRNEKPGTRNPENDDAKPGTRLHETRNPGSAEPSGSIKDPSSKVRAREVSEILEQWVTPEAAASFIAYRRKHKAKGLTATGANRLGKHLVEIIRRGGDPSDALGMVEEKGWASIEPDWYFREGQKNGPSDRQKFGAAINRLADDLSAGRVQLRTDDRNPFAPRSG